MELFSSCKPKVESLGVLVWKLRSVLLLENTQPAINMQKTVTLLVTGTTSVAIWHLPSPILVQHPSLAASTNIFSFPHILGIIYVGAPSDRSQILKQCSIYPQIYVFEMCDKIP